MIIKLILSLALVLLSLFVLTQSAVSRVLRYGVILCLMCGAYFVWLPEHATLAAHALGVGRGADLLLYLWVVITFGMMLLIYLKIVETNRIVTLLAREMTIARVPPPPFSPDPIDLRSGAYSPRGGTTMSEHAPRGPSTTP